MDTLRSSVLKDLKCWSEEKSRVKYLKKFNHVEPTGCKQMSLSDSAREEGNELLTLSHIDSKIQHKILYHYNESIAYAPVGSEVMAKAYANKSALLLHMRKYKESLSEAEKALAITKLTSLRVKLLCRKAECLTALGLPENRSCLEKARFALNKSEVSIKINEALKKLIEKAQFVVDEEKLDTPKENKRKIEVSKVIADEEGKDIWKSVELKHSPKYSRHLVAVRDFQPGDVILVEKPYLYHLKEPRAHQYCCKCFNYLWTVVPCDHCCWRMFCSEECKKEAWREYHDLECSVMSRMEFVFGMQWDDKTPFLLSIFFKALKEAGNIDRLLNDFKSSMIEDECNSGLDYKTILASPTVALTREELRAYSHSSVIVLISLAKFTTILKKSYGFDEIGKLMKNDEAISLGCLLLKFSTAIDAGCVLVRLVNPILQDGSVEAMNMTEDSVEQDKSLHPVINVMTMMTLVGCIPNVEGCRTIGHKSVMFALQPIKAGTPLILGSKSLSIYRRSPKFKRQNLHRKFYKCSCDCQACTENWQRIDSHIGSSFRWTSITPGSNSYVLQRLKDEYRSIVDQYQSHVLGHKPNYPDVKTVDRVRSFVTEACQYFALPSPELFHSINMMGNIIRGFHSPDKNLFTSL